MNKDVERRPGNGTAWEELDISNDFMFGKVMQDLYKSL